MPILTREPSCFPEDLFEAAAPSLESSDCRWWVVYTKTRQEKALARQLAKLQVSHFLPVVRKTRVAKRKTESYIPLFPSYMFLFGRETDRVKALTTNRIVSVLPVRDQQRLHFDLTQVKRLVDSKKPLTLERQLFPGRGVRITQGALQGIEGVITKRRSRSLLIVAVHLMRQGVSISIDELMVEAID